MLVKSCLKRVLTLVSILFLMNALPAYSLDTSSGGNIETYKPEKISSSEHYGGTLFNFVTESEAAREKRAIERSKLIYKKFLSRGRYSRVKSIGGYSGGGSSASSYSIRRASRSSRRTRSSSRSTRRGGFATISNSGNGLSGIGINN